MKELRIGAYVGIDPTAASLHVGHLLPLMALFWMYIHGFRAFSVIGGATVKIGDPTDRLKGRDLLPKVTLTTNIAKMHFQLKRLWLNVEAQAQRYDYEKDWAWQRGLFNNSMWYNNLPFVEVVQRLFAGMRMGPMLSRDTVKRRLVSGEGMSLAEFVYPLMQAWDWWHMFKSPRPVQMQIGGSDQYGNIISGIEAIKYIRDHEPDPTQKMPDDLHHTPVGFTTPLLTDSSGAKFGKSAGNAVWLDRFMTTTYDLYGYFVRRPDDDVENLLKLFTFLPMSKIKEVMEEQNKDPSKRVAQHLLAFEVVTLVHGIDDARDAQARHIALYARHDNSDEAELKFVPEPRTPMTANAASRFRADIQLPESLIFGKSIQRILYGAGLATSATEANRLTKQNGASIAGAPGQKAAINKGISYGDLTYTPVRGWFPEDTRNFIIDNKLLILRRGKHFIRVIEIISDEEWEKSGKSYPGEPYKGAFRLLVAALRKAGGDEKLKFSTSELQAILAAVDNVDFDRKINANAATKMPKLTFPERRARGDKINRDHKTSLERALMGKKNKLKAAEVLLEKRRTGIAFNDDFASGRYEPAEEDVVEFEDVERPLFRKEINWEKREKKTRTDDLEEDNDVDDEEERRDGW